MTPMLASMIEQIKSHPGALDSYVISAAAEMAETHIRRLEEAVRVLIENDPYDAISDGGHTVLELWRYESRKLLGEGGSVQ